MFVTIVACRGPTYFEELNQLRNENVKETQKWFNLQLRIEQNFNCQIKKLLFEAAD